MKLLAEYNKRKYVIKYNAISSMESLVEHLASVVQGFHKNVEIEYYDRDFESYAVLSDVNEIKDLTRLRLSDKEGLRKEDVSKEKLELKPSSSVQKVPLSERLQFKITCGSQLDENDYEEIRKIVKNELSRENLYKPTPDFCAKFATKICSQYLSSKPNRTQVLDTLKHIIIKSLQPTVSRSIKRKVQEDHGPAKKRAVKESTKILLAAGALPYFLPEMPRDDKVIANMKTMIELMKREMEKPSPRSDVIAEYMKQTLTLRRHHIVKKQYSAKRVKMEYPGLFQEQEIMNEFDRICNEKMKVPEKIIQAFSKLKDGLHVLTKSTGKHELLEKLCGADESISKPDLYFKFAMTGMSLLLKDDLSAIYSKKVADCTNDRISIHYVNDNLTRDKPLDADKYVVCVEGIHINCKSSLNAFCVCLAAHYAFNIGYAREFFNFFTFIEYHILGLTTMQGTPPIVRRTVSNIKKYFSATKHKCPLIN